MTKLLYLAFHLFWIGMLSIQIGCKNESPEPQPLPENTEQEVQAGLRSASTETKLQPPDYDTLHWTELTEEMGMILDIRYATENNFTEKQIYECGRCFLRPALAEKVTAIQEEINRRHGWRLKLYDCYRPSPAQALLWEIVPDARYVTPPDQGSMHNRGLAVDINIVDEHGVEMDMGTPYDDFTRLSHTDHRDLLPPEVMKNRDTLTQLMLDQGLTGIRTEWWHYSLEGQGSPLSDWEWPCD